MGNQKIMQLVEHAMKTGTLKMPTLPHVALAIGQIIRRDDVDARSVANEIAKDPGITAGLLRIANSATMRGTGKKVENLKLAIARLGFNMTRVLVNRMVMTQMFRAKDPVLMGILKLTWAKSVEVAALSKVLAADRTKLNPETAMLAGLVHLVGVLPIIKVIEEHPALTKDEDALKQAIAALHPRIGRLVLQSWTFPAELLDVPPYAFDFMRVHQGPADYADVVSVAIVQLGYHDEPELASLDRSIVPAYEKLKLAADLGLLDTPEVRKAHDDNKGLLSD